MKQVLFDASCWVAAAGSPSGGSSLILRLGQAGKLKIVSSARILEEAERIIGKKLGSVALARFYKVLADVDPKMVEECTSVELKAWNTLVHEKDCHILAAAVKAEVDVLVSLDRHHILIEDVRNGFPITVCDTKEFLTTIAADIDPNGAANTNANAK